MLPLHPSSSLSRRGFLSRTSTGLAAAAAAHLLPRSLNAATEPRRMGIVLVGLGNYSTRELLPAIKESQHLKLVGVVTGSADKGRAWAREHGFPERNVWNYSEMARMAEAPEAELVYVVTPNSLHAEHSIAALRAGKHVICEKPMAISVAECDQMMAAATAANRSLTMGYRLHFDPYHQELIRRAQAGTDGPYLAMSGGFGFTMGRKVWRAERALAGGGPLMDVGIYALHEACLAAQADPVALTARERPKKRPDLFVDVEEALDWTMEFANGARADLFTSYADNMNRFRAEGPRGWIELEPAYSYRGLKARTHEGPLSYPVVRQQTLHLDALALALRQGTPVPTPAELGRRDMVIIEGIYESARTGRRVTLRY